MLIYINIAGITEYRMWAEVTYVGAASHCWVLHFILVGVAVKCTVAY